VPICPKVIKQTFTKKYFWIGKKGTYKYFKNILTRFLMQSCAAVPPNEGRNSGIAEI
jgi:hypothetical protein